MDAYVRQARLKPALIVATPLVLATFFWPVDGAWGWKAFGGVVVALGGTDLLGRLGGYLGKKREPSLWDHFGGRPTEVMLSHDSGRTNPHSLARWHARLEVLSGVHMPTQEEEARDPYAARQAYEAATDCLRARARAAPDKYPLVFANNCDFGFCRNIWAMKPIGLLVTGGVAVILTLKLYSDMTSRNIVAEPAVGVVAVTLILLVFWAWVNRRWVKQAADRYAKALLETVDMP